MARWSSGAADAGAERSGALSRAPPLSLWLALSVLLLRPRLLPGQPPSAGAPSWKSLSRETEPCGGPTGTCEVEVVDVFGETAIRFLRLESVLLGAQYLDPAFEGQSVFANFAVLQGAVEFMVAPIAAPSRVLVLGLGAGAVPTALRRLQRRTVVDVVERSRAVTKAATRHFGYVSARTEAGRTITTDAVEFLRSKRPKRAQTYDVIVHDLYDGTNSALAPDLLVRLRDHWLREDGRGVLLLNVVAGYSASPSAAASAAVGDAAASAKHPHALLQFVAARLAAVFPHVRALCEAPCDSLAADYVGNVVFAASAASLPDWEVPSTGYYVNPGVDSHDWIVKHFRNWTLALAPTAAAATSASLSEEAGGLAAAAAATRAAMWARVRPHLPREAWRGAWTAAEKAAAESLGAAAGEAGIGLAGGAGDSEL